MFAGIWSFSAVHRADVFGQSSFVGKSLVTIGTRVRPIFVMHGGNVLNKIITSLEFRGAHGTW